LDVPPAYFFAGIEGAAPPAAAPPSALAGGKIDERQARQAVGLVRAFNRIGDAALRRRLADLIKALASSD
jgi:hypothetical protein